VQSAPAPAQAPEPARAPAAAASQAPAAPQSPAAPAPQPFPLRDKREPLPTGSSADVQAPAAAGSVARPQTSRTTPLAKELRAQSEEEKELERIATLRVQGRDAEADKALDEFRRAHPDYRIPDAMWERVKPR
jgi:hypothetical protein